MANSLSLKIINMATDYSAKGNPGVQTYSKNSSGVTVANSAPTASYANSGTPGNANAGLATYSAPNSPGTQPVAATGAIGRAMNDATATTQVNPANAPIANLSAVPTAGNTTQSGNIRLSAGQQQTYDTAINALKQKYQGGKVQADNSGVQAGATQGASAGMIQSTTGGTTVDAQSPLTGIVETDTAFDDIFKQFDDYFSPVKQKQSLLEEYKSMESALGINSMNEELLNSKRIIEGTEDDIRSEVQSVSGFASDSQVLALANARNKSLVKNYNYLLEARTSAMTQLTTMMNLSVQDRTLAQNEFDSKMNFVFKVAEFKEKALSNAREGYKNTLTLMGADGMYNALLATGDPSALALAERTMGIPSGGLALAATQAVTDRANKLKADALELKVKEANIRQSDASATASYASAAKTKSEMAGGSKADAKINKGVETAGIVLKKVAEATNKVTGGTTGFLGKVGSKIAGTSAYELARAVDTIVANIGFDTLQAMRDASPTGGALGQVSEREIALLQSTVASLDVGQSADVLKRNLQEVATHYENWLHTVGYAVDPETNEIIQITDAQ